MKFLMGLASLTCVLTMANTARAISETQLIAYKIDQRGAEFTVRTGGCTSKDSFELALNPLQDENDEYELYLERIVDDHCDGWFPEGTKIRYSYEELGIDDVNGNILYVLNPLF